MENFPKIPLKEYYDSLPEKETLAPKQELIEKIAGECGVSASSVYRWLKEGIPARFRKKVKDIIDQHKTNRKVCQA